MNRVLFAFFVVLLWMGQAQAATNGYFNSAESGCDGSDPNVLYCDDVETLSPAPVNGYWGACLGDINLSSCGGTPELCNKGWASAGTPTTGNGNTVAGQGVGGSRAATHTWAATGACQGAGNHHPFAPNRTGQNEIWVRWYQKWPSGYQFGAEKVMTVNATPYTEGIFWGNVHCNKAAASTSPTCDMVWQGGGTANGLSVPSDIGSGSLTVTSGVWWALQLHLKRNSTPSASDGVVAMYADNCGANGTSCSGNMTLRWFNNAHQWPGRGTNDQFFDNWFENFSNPLSTGGAPLLDNFKTSKIGPLGFFDASTVPPSTAPCCLLGCTSPGCTPQ